MVSANSLITSVDTKHEDQIHDCQFDFYGTRLATASSDKSIKIFEVNNDKTTYLTQITSHDGPVWQLSWAHPKFGPILASAGFDKKVMVHQEQADGTWKTIYSFEDHKTSVNTCQFAPAEFGLILACGSCDGNVSVIYNQEGKWESCLFDAHASGVNALSWAPSPNMGSLICEPSNAEKNERKKRIVVAGNNQAIKIYEEVTHGEWREERNLEGHSDWVRGVAWAPSTGLNRDVIASCDHQGEARVWTKQDGVEWESKILRKFSYPLWDVSWSVTGNVLAVSGGDNNVSLWRELPDGGWKCISDSDDTAQQTGS